jgi:HEAT repeat protein
VSVRLEAVDMLQRIGTRFAIPPLSEALKDPNESVRAKAADALGKIGLLEKDIAGILGAAFATEKSVAVRIQMVGALGMVRERAGLDYLKVAMLDKDPTVRKHATEVYSRVIAFK